MKGSFNFTLDGIETKIEGIPIKIGEIHVACSGERSWWDMFIIHRFIKAMPKWMSRLYSEITKLEQMK